MGSLYDKEIGIFCIKKNSMKLILIDLKKRIKNNEK